MTIREPINAITHLIGAILSVVALVYFVVKGALMGQPIYVVGGVIFGGSLIALYTTSTVYHWANSSEKAIRMLRKLDHTMIYILIAGTYTPICLTALKGWIGYTLLGIVWGLSIVGIILKYAWLDAPRWLYTTFYVVLGWLAVFAIVPLYKSLPFYGFLLLLSGGLFYTIGAIIYGTKSRRIKLWKFGFHEIFHLFILAGSASHFILIAKYVIV
jgi:hemolysin III